MVMVMVMSTSIVAFADSEVEGDATNQCFSNEELSASLVNTKTK